MSEKARRMNPKVVAVLFSTVGAPEAPPGENEQASNVTQNSEGADDGGDTLVQDMLSRALEIRFGSHYGVLGQQRGVHNKRKDFFPSWRCQLVDDGVASHAFSPLMDRALACNSERMILERQ